MNSPRNLSVGYPHRARAAARACRATVRRGFGRA